MQSTMGDEGLSVCRTRAHKAQKEGHPRFSVFSIEALCINIVSHCNPVLQNGRGVTVVMSGLPLITH